MKKLVLPSRDGQQEITSPHCFVLVGANGSGKSHLGAWIENHSEDVLRISAQRALSIPDRIIVESEETAWNKVVFGNEKEKNKGYKWNWGNYTTQLVDDYNSVLSALFARSNKEHQQYVELCKECERNGVSKPNVPPMILDKVIDIWNTVFPQRNIILKDTSVKAIAPNNEEYPGKQMSDGERVAIYLLGQCLIAPVGSTIIIDEPEIHLHKSIISLFWDKIEEYCKEITIVYITHDLDFAASRKESTKVWVKSYDGKDNWELEILNSNEDLPDALYLQILGSRQPVLFVEGDNSSYDHQLYQLLYSKYQILSAHNCSGVIELTRSLNNNELLKKHNLLVKGIIDRDYLTKEEIQAYEKEQIYVLRVAEVENLFLVEDIIRTIALHLEKNPDEVFDGVKGFLFDEFEKEFDNQVISACTREIRFRLSSYSKPGELTIDGLKAEVKRVEQNVDIDNLYNSIYKRFSGIKENRDYTELLTVFNRKSLPRRVSHIFGLSNNEYPALVLRLLKSEKNKDILLALRKCVPML